MRIFLGGAVLALGLAVGCGGPNPDFPNMSCSDFDHANCVEIASGDSAALLEAVNALDDDTAVILGLGTYELDNQVTIRANGVCLIGQGMDETVLSFGTVTAQINGVDAVGDDFLVQDFTVLDAVKDAIRVEDSAGVSFVRVKTTWTTPEDSENGAYGVYPVRCTNVLVEECVVENASDAGLYVGQSINVIVRNNVATGNVAGIEIENTQYADVYGNTATGNTGGLLIFDLPGNPIAGRDVRVHDNTITDNNVANFAPGGTVAIIPAGTGTLILASRRVELTNNTYANNDTGDIAIINGLVVDEDPSAWELDPATIVGDWDDLGLLPGATAGTVTNFRTENIVVSGNQHSGSGTFPDTSQDFGILIAFLFPGEPMPSILYDTMGESAFDAVDPTANSNDNHICAGGNTAGTGFASVDLASQLPILPMTSPILILETAPYAPFDCTVLDGGPIADVVLP